MSRWKSAEGLRAVVFDASRISFSGIYVHSAPWSVGQQGYSDVSNGCLNVSPDNARWFRQNTLRGDVVVIVKNTVRTASPGRRRPGRLEHPVVGLEEQQRNLALTWPGSGWPRLRKCLGSHSREIKLAGS